MTARQGTAASCIAHWRPLDDLRRRGSSAGRRACPASGTHPHTGCAAAPLAGNTRTRWVFTRSTWSHGHIYLRCKYVVTWSRLSHMLVRGHIYSTCRQMVIFIRHVETCSDLFSSFKQSSLYHVSFLSNLSVLPSLIFVYHINSRGSVDVDKYIVWLLSIKTNPINYRVSSRMM